MKRFIVPVLAVSIVVIVILVGCAQPAPAPAPAPAPEPTPSPPPTDEVEYPVPQPEPLGQFPYQGMMVKPDGTPYKLSIAIYFLGFLAQDFTKILIREKC